MTEHQNLTVQKRLEVACDLLSLTCGICLLGTATVAQQQQHEEVEGGTVQTGGQHSKCCQLSSETNRQDTHKRCRTATAARKGTRPSAISQVGGKHQQLLGPSTARCSCSPVLVFLCRLPVESAKKLRWYDNADLAKMSVQHVREKHLLLDTITALKKVTGS